ncbi:Myb-like DNA-binding domain containing protein [Trichomonas vaginalis G3]|uniref:Myb-like DNA-binding domain containing protein n=1 Tax=Trichomonas vaginalis (strain ATCC PRA-98 / G3) TaxID=412133 RepID=A2FUZ3_TRIV3|nr:RNA polymerase II transcription regulator recruiting protein [Trichomonas vaginalis G3]EAX91284.1 Myb-like DNA-binding domain containing protein [Trichomonas vaginalis G3]KAI5538452.1 RNA polymerase II transcription regulator recruiting protein [Trichomonas vaginalis G3]|eukprot:XP_001304214.1 Myb-like DNA-binding domain containing protein [Trichomonas vaginalis G3]
MDRLLPNGHTPYDDAGSRSKFTPREDRKLLKLVQEAGRSPNWREISNIMQTRTPRQCRERYQNYLCPKINHKDFTPEEDEMILKQFDIHENKWNAIARCFKGRTGNMIRNRWQTLIRKQNKKFRIAKKLSESEELENDSCSKESLGSAVSCEKQPHLFDALFTIMDYEHILNDDRFIMSYVGSCTQ